MNTTRRTCLLCIAAAATALASCGSPKSADVKFHGYYLAAGSGLAGTARG